MFNETINDGIVIKDLHLRRKYYYNIALVIYISEFSRLRTYAKKENALRIATVGIYHHVEYNVPQAIHIFKKTKNMKTLLSVVFFYFFTLMLMLVILDINFFQGIAFDNIAYKLYTHLVGF